MAQALIRLDAKVWEERGRSYLGDPTGVRRDAFGTLDSHDQFPVWEQIHQQHSFIGHNSATSLARGLVRRLPSAQRLLELGCGSGEDAAFLGRNGHTVVATDFSNCVIDFASRRYGGKCGVIFKKQDLRERLNFPDGGFDGVYARLSLHYFSEAQTRLIMAEIARVLKPSGRLLFMCKSTDDPLFGLGELIAPNTYCYKGHVRHFFDISYTSELLSFEGYFKIEQLRQVSQSVYGATSSVVICSAVRMSNYRQPRLF
jgi:ubiquinone/menaquinone biosynthesis C-methylase UbiE